MDPVIFSGLIIMAIVVWWFIGTCILIYELRHYSDVSLGGIVMAMSLGMIGPVALVCTVTRLWGDKPIFKKFSN